MKKKVLIVATVQSHIAQFHKPLINLLQINGYEVHIAAKNNLTEKNGLKLDEPDKKFDIPFERHPFKVNNYNAFKQLSNIISEEHYSIVHCNTPMGGVIARLAANKYRKKGTKVFYTAHGFHFYQGAPIKNWIIYYPIEKALSTITDKIITITNEDYNLSKRNFKTKSSIIHGVGVDPNRFCVLEKEKKNMVRESLGINKETVLILCVGELNKNKNQKVVIESLYNVVKKNNNIKLLLAGNGPEKKNLQELVDKLKLNNYVEFLGYIPNIELYTKICDIVISVSYREGLPLNIIEGLLCGKLCVVSNNRGHRELITNDSNGYILNENTPKEVANILGKIINEEINIQAIVENTTISAEKYQIKNVISELQYIYEL